MSAAPLVSLESICESIDYGVTASASELPDGPKFLRITDIQDGAVNWVSVPWCECSGRERAKALLRPGDIVFARTGATTGKSYLIRECPDDCVFASYLIRVRLGADVDPIYVSHFFQSQDYWTQITQTARGAAQPGVNATSLAALKVPLPPLPEQRRIAAILDQAEALRAKRRAALAKLDNLAQSIFIEMFGDQARNSLDWPEERLGAYIVDGPQNGLYKPADQYGEGVPILRIDGFYAGRLVNPDGLKRVRLSSEEVQTYGLNEGDVVVNRVNSPEYLGKCALIPALKEQTVFESNMMRMAVDVSRLNPTYLVAALQGPGIKAQIQTRAKHAINQSSINQKDVQGFTLPIPPIDLQRRFAERLQKIESIGKSHCASLSNLDALFASLQHRAFRGEL